MKSDPALKLALYLLLIVIMVKLVLELNTLLICLIMSVTLAAALTPVADRLEKKTIPRMVTVAGVYCLAFALYSLVACVLWPILVKQSQDLFNSMPGVIQWLTNRSDHLTTLVQPLIAPESLKSLPEKIISLGQKMALGALKFTGNLFSFLINGIFVLFLTAYFTVEGPHLVPALIKWLPVNARQRATLIVPALTNRLGGYVRGQLLVSLAVASIISVGLSLIGVESALVLGIISGLLNLVPFIGSFITMILAVIIAFKQAIWMGLAVLGLFVVEQWLESNFIVPNLLGKQVDLHPLVVLFAVIIGGTTMGLAGALIAVPLATISLFFAEEFYYKKLNESSPGN